MADCSIPRYGAVTVTIFACSTAPSPYSASAPTTAPLACNTPLQRTADASFCSPHTLFRHHHQARETPPLSFPLRDRPFSSILDRFFLRLYIHPSLILPSILSSSLFLHRRPAPYSLSTRDPPRPITCPRRRRILTHNNSHQQFFFSTCKYALYSFSLPSHLSFPSTVP